MFQIAVSIAAQFTFPIIMSRQTVGGECSSNIGTGVVVNSDGWIVTAGHILSKWVQLAEGMTATQAALDFAAELDQNKNLTNKERARRREAGPRAAKQDTRRCSLWAGWQGAQLQDIRFLPVALPGWGEVIDLGIARLQPFDSAWVKTYPTFKDPRKDFEPGKSLCKLGFPFHQIQPTWDEAAQMFRLPPGSLPMPRFPLEGIFTRVSEVQVTDDPPPYPIRYVETSSPGLLGQSGGPTFDVQGTVWAIQAKTAHLPLGFAGQNQFLNVGLGVHPDTMFPLLDEAGVKYQVSDY